MSVFFPILERSQCPFGVLFGVLLERNIDVPFHVLVGGHLTIATSGPEHITTLLLQFTIFCMSDGGDNFVQRMLLGT